MAFGFRGQRTNGGTAGPTASVTHLLAISSNDLVVATVHSNGQNTAITPAAQGAAWQTADERSVSAETARFGLFWKVAGASEPATYNFTVASVGEWRVVLKVFTAASASVADSALNYQRRGQTSINLICDASNNKSVADNAVSIVVGAQDARDAVANPITGVDNSYVSPVGDKASQVTAMAHRLWGTGGNDASITLTPQDAFVEDNVYSYHMSWIESAPPAVELPFQPIMVRQAVQRGATF